MTRTNHALIMAANSPSMIARCRAKCWVVQLKEEKQSVVTPDSQRGMKGHHYLSSTAI